MISNLTINSFVAFLTLFKNNEYLLVDDPLHFTYDFIYNII